MSTSGLTNDYNPPTVDGLTIIDADQIYIDGSLLDTTNLVPYTGANKPVDVGAQPIRTTYAPVASSDVVNLYTLTNAVAFVDNSVALTYLNRITTSAQSVAGPVTFTNGLQTSANKDVSLASTLIITPNYQSTTTSASVTVGQYFGAITNSSGVYQATCTNNPTPILVLFPVTAGHRYTFSMETLIQDASYEWTIDIYQSNDNVYPYPNFNEAVLDSHIFAPSSTVFRLSTATFNATTTGSVVITISSPRPSGIGTIQWKNLALYNMGVAVTNVTMPSQTADRVLVLDANKRVVASGINTTKLGYLDNVSSDIQTQLNTKASTTYVDIGLAGKLNLSGSNANQNIILGSYKVQSSAVPSTGNDYINKTYGDATYATTSALSGYLPLTGGTLSGALNQSTGLTDNFANALGVVQTALFYNAGSFNTTTANIISGLQGGTISGSYRLTALSLQASMAMAISGFTAGTFLPGEVYTYTFTGVQATTALNLQVLQNLSINVISVNPLTNPISASAGQTITGSFIISANTGGLLNFNFQAGVANPWVQWTGFTLTRGGTFTNTITNNQLFIRGDNMPFVSRASSTLIPAQLVVGNTSNGERLLLGNYYTGGVGSGCVIQSSNYYSSAEHGDNLLLNPIGGYLGVGKSSGGNVDPLAKFTINASYYDDDVGGFCINASDSTANPNAYSLRLFPYVQGSGQVAYRFRTYNTSTLYDSFTILSTGGVDFMKPITTQTITASGSVSGSNFTTGGAYILTNRGDCRFYNGNQDNYSPGTLNNNLIIKSWWGIAYESYDNIVRIGMNTRDGSSYFEGNMGIGVTNPSAKLHISNRDNSKAYFGPNTTWGSYLYVGSGTSNMDANTAQVITTNGNLHLDAGYGKDIYLGIYPNLASQPNNILCYGKVYLSTTPILNRSPEYTVTRDPLDGRVIFSPFKVFQVYATGGVPEYENWNGREVFNAFTLASSCNILFQGFVTFYADAGGRRFAFCRLQHVPTGVFYYVEFTKYFNIGSSHEIVPVNKMMYGLPAGSYNIYFFTGGNVYTDANDRVQLSAIVYA